MSVPSDGTAAPLPIAAAPSAPLVESAAPAPTSGAAAKKFQRGPTPSKEVLHALLVKHKGVVADIAKEMQRSRAQVYRWLEDRELDATAFRE